MKKMSMKSVCLKMFKFYPSVVHKAVQNKYLNILFYETLL